MDNILGNDWLGDNIGEVDGRKERKEGRKGRKSTG